MTERAEKKIVLAAMGVAALTLNLLLVLGMGPLATSALEGLRAHALLKAGGVAFHAVSAAARDQATRVAGNALMGAAKGTTHFYAALLCLTPPERAGHSRCRVAPRSEPAPSVFPSEGPASPNDMVVGATPCPESCIRRVL